MPLKLNRSAFLLLLFVSPLFLTSSAFAFQPSGEPGVTFDTLWIDYNAVQDNQFGMLIHINFSVMQLQNVSVNLGYAVEFANGDKVLADNTAYASTNGQLTVYRTLNNRFEISRYTDVSVFLPYREIPVVARNRDLRFHVDVLYENGGNLHLTYYNFSFVQ